ncbi:hypothetical protein HK104_006463, partial [Borealophlyctis nickersoniae]
PVCLKADLYQVSIHIIISTLAATWPFSVHNTSSGNIQLRPKCSNHNNDYTTDFTKLLSEARAAKSAEFSQDNLKTWFLSGLRPLCNQHGRWIADLTIPAAMALHGTSVPGTKFTRSDVTLPEVQEAALSVYQSRGWSDEHPPRQKTKVEASPAFGKMRDKRELPKPYDRPSNSDIACYYCGEKGHIKRDCAKWKKAKKGKAKVNNTDAKGLDNTSSGDSSAYLLQF